MKHAQNRQSKSGMAWVIYTALALGMFLSGTSATACITAFGVATNLAVGSTISAALEAYSYCFYGHYVDQYRFTLTSATSVSITMTSTTAGMYPLLSLHRGINGAGTIVDTPDTSTSKIVNKKANLSPGTYYILAVSHRAGNYTLNLSGASTARSDLVLTTVASPTAASTGSIKVSATVKNQGTASANQSRLVFFFSKDTVITTSDINNDYGCTIPPLSAGATNVCSGSIPVPSSLAAGTYYVGAYADTNGEVAESNETNNGRAAPNSTVISQPPRPDLVVTKVTNPARGKVNGNINVFATVKNQGTASANRSWLVFVYSPDKVITTSDINNNYGCNIPSLSAGASYNCSGSILVPASLPVYPTGTSYYVGAYADTKGEIAESNETNNGLAGQLTMFTK